MKYLILNVSSAFIVSDLIFLWIVLAKIDGGCCYAICTNFYKFTTNAVLFHNIDRAKLI
jgi:hypothetical protein